MSTADEPATLVELWRVRTVRAVREHGSASPEAGDAYRAYVMAIDAWDAALAAPDHRQETP